MSDGLSNPWSALPETAPFVLPGDAPDIEIFNASAAEIHKLRLQIVPEPYLGNPDASVVFLTLNPGFVEADTPVHLDPVFNTAARANLLHARERWPLYLLDPALPSPGHDWWMRRLRPLIDAVGSAETVSENVFVAEVHGYHSVKYRHQSALLPSQAYTIHLVRRAIDRDAQFLIMRAGSIWLDLVPELRDARCVRLNSAQNVTVSPRNCPAGFATIVARVRES